MEGERRKRGKEEGGKRKEEEEEEEEKGRLLLGGCRRPGCNRTSRSREKRVCIHDHNLSSAHALHSGFQIPNLMSAETGAETGCFTPCFVPRVVLDPNFRFFD